MEDEVFEGGFDVNPNNSGDVSFDELELGTVYNEDGSQAEDETEEVTEEDNNEEQQEDPLSEHIENKEEEEQDEEGGSMIKPLLEALAEEGVLMLDEGEEIAGESVQDLMSAIEKTVSKKLEGRYKYIDEALSSGVEVSTIQQYEQDMKILDSIDSNQVSGMNDESIELRKRLIFQDFINRGYTEERAAKEVDKSLKAGTDIDDALDALEGLKYSTQARYSQEIEEAKALAEQQRQASASRIEGIIKAASSMDDFGDAMGLSKQEREKAVASIIIPRIEYNGQYITELDKHALENPEDFYPKLAMIYKATDGFKNLSKLSSKIVSKKVSSKVNNLEKMLRGNYSGGKMKLSSGTSQNNILKTGFKFDF